jgi:hypothetical protein
MIHRFKGLYKHDPREVLGFKIVISLLCSQILSDARHLEYNFNSFISIFISFNIQINKFVICHFKIDVTYQITISLVIDYY